MADSSTGKNWFTQDFRSSNSWSPSSPPGPISGNGVDAFIQPLDYYVSLGASIRACGSTAGDFVYIAGWELDLSTFVDPVGASNRATLLDLLVDACKRGVQVRVLLDSSFNRTQNTATAKQIEKLGGGAILDQFRQPTGAHHQKISICRASGKVKAYCGGMDIANHRLGRDGLNAPPNNSTPDEMRHAEWHDVQVVVIGPAAVDIWYSFVQRWRTTTRAVFASPTRSFMYLFGLSDVIFGVGSITEPKQSDPAAAQSGTLDCQVVRTYPNIQVTHLGVPGSRYPIVLGYQFAAAGERGIFDLLLHAIDNTDSTIYLEDQYLVDSAPAGALAPITDALSRTLKKSTFKQMVIAIAGTGTIQADLYQAGSRRKAFYSQLGSIASSNVSIYCYKADLNSPWWFHSKTWIFDDDFAVVSSANCNRRSYTNDSELGVAVYGSDRTGANFAKALRMKLWLKHLNALPANAPPSSIPLATEADVQDFAAAADLWKKAPLLVPADLANDQTPDVLLSDSFLRAFGILTTSTFFPGFDALVARARSTNRDVEWDLIDPNGT